MKNLGNQITLGTFVSTFLYSLLVLRFIQAGNDPFVPHIAVTFALILTVVSLGVLVFFFHSVANQIQAENTIDLVNCDLMESINRMFPKKNETSHTPKTLENQLPSDFDQKSEAIKVNRSGHIQTIDVDHLLQISIKHNLILKLNYRAGHYLHKNKSFLFLYPSENATDDLVQEIQEAITVGRKRTSTQDIEFPINQLVEIAVRALSPGINDPFTAMQCINALTSSLSSVAARHIPSNLCFDEEGHIRLMLSNLTFSGVLDSAFNQIRQNTRSAVSVRIKLLESLSRIAEEAIREKDRLYLHKQGEMIYEASKKEGVFEPADQEDILDRYEHLKNVVYGKADSSEN
jgi:uncharacterized membrane protein